MKPAVLRRIIERRRKVFTEATPSQRRVLVAKDVIKQINDNKIIADTGNWVTNLPTNWIGSPSYNKDESLQCRMLGDPEFSCTACALGSIMVSLVGFKNQVKTTGAGSVLSWQHLRRKSSDVIGIQKLFSKKQLSMIEIAFERGSGYFQKDKRKAPISAAEYNRCRAFGDETYGPHDRLIAIMKNIIKNKGEFVP